MKFQWGWWITVLAFRRARDVSLGKNETRVNPMAPLGNARDHRTKFTACITLNVDKI